MRLLLVEDDPDLAAWISRLLKKDLVVVDCIGSGEEADIALNAVAYDIVILDLGLPEVPGTEVLRRFRKRNTHTPVLILTANDAMSSRVASLDAGADDYLVKPFDVEELHARIRARLRRTTGRREAGVTFGPLALESATRQFQLFGEPLHLTLRETAALETLIHNAGRTVSKARLSEAMFGLNDDASSTAIEIHIHRLRKKIEGKGVRISTLRGLGYVLSLQHGVDHAPAKP